MKAVVSSLVPGKIKESLCSFADVFYLAPDETVAAPVCTHPDMILSVIGGIAFLPRLYVEKNPLLCSFLSQNGYDPVVCESKRTPVYPYDVGLNCAVGDDFLITRAKSTEMTVLEYARQLNYEVIDVNQGYAGCSCIVCGDSVITSDSSIFSAVKSTGRDCLLIPNDGIILPGYDAGFIGGCGGFCNGVLYFFGNIDSVICGKQIREFAERKKYTIKCLSDDTLTDYGGLKFI